MQYALSALHWLWPGRTGRADLLQLWPGLAGGRMVVVAVEKFAQNL